MARRDNDRYRKPPLENLFQQLHAIQLGHPQVGDHDTVGTLEKQTERLVPVPSEINLDSQRQLKQLLKRPTGILIILNDQDSSRWLRWSRHGCDLLTSIRHRRLFSNGNGSHWHGSKPGRRDLGSKPSEDERILIEICLP
jgi:hypothetical protein